MRCRKGLASGCLSCSFGSRELGSNVFSFDVRILSQVVFERAARVTLGLGTEALSAELVSGVCSLSVESRLMEFLLRVGCVLIHLVFAVVVDRFLHQLGLAESVVKHLLIVGHEVHLAAELLVVVVLTL